MAPDSDFCATICDTEAEEQRLPHFSGLRCGRNIVTRIDWAMA